MPHPVGYFFTNNIKNRLPLQKKICYNIPKGMKRILLSLMVCALCAASAVGAGRTSDASLRTKNQTTIRTSRATVSRNAGQTQTKTRTIKARRAGIPATARGAITTSATRNATRVLRMVPRNIVRATITPANNVITNAFDENYIESEEKEA